MSFLSCCYGKIPRENSLWKKGFIELSVQVIVYHGRQLKASGGQSPCSSCSHRQEAEQGQAVLMLGLLLFCVVWKLLLLFAPLFCVV